VSERASPSKIKKILTTKKIQKFVFVTKRKERERERESAVWCRLLEKKKKNCVETSGNQWLRFD
jgi:hypothetical protein